MKKKTLLILLFVCSMGVGAVACSKSHGNDDPDGGDASTDTDTGTDTDTDTGEEWCPKLETSCEAPEELEVCDVVKLGAPRLIFPLSGRHIRDRRPQIIWEEADGATQYRLEIARDRQFTDVVYRSADNEPYPGYDDRLHHIVSCDLDCGVHFFRVKSVTSPECESGASSYTWEMFVGMAPGDLDRDGVPDIMYWKIIEPGGEMQPYLVQGWAFFDLDEKGGQVAEAEKVVEFEVEGSTIVLKGSTYQGDVNGDASTDVSVEIIFLDAAYEFETAIIETYVFSQLRSGVLQGKNDAIGLFQGSVGQLYNTLYSNRYSDVNGDGYSDIAISFYEDYGDTGFTDKLLIFYGTTETVSVLDLSTADVVIPCPIGCDSDTNFGRPASQVDINGDGFADLFSALVEYSSGIFDAGLSHSAIIFGDENLQSQVDVMTEGAIISSPQYSIISGVWDLGDSVFLGSGAVNPMGDIDFDGYPELGGYLLDAYDTTQSPLVETGGWVVFDDFFGSGQHMLPDVMDTIIVADFDTYIDYSNTETISFNHPSGDVDGDGIDDFILLTGQANSGSPTYPGRYFYLYGEEDWDDFIPLSTISANEVIIPIDAFCLVTTDIDGDGIAESIGASTSGNHTVQLSASGETVELNWDWSDAVDFYGPVIPEIY